MNATLTWVDAQDAGNAQAQLILQAIARHADWETGEAHPSRERIAMMAKCSKRTVNRYIDKLESDGLIERLPQSRANGSQTANVYRLVGYVEWAKAVHNGGVVAKPKRVEKYDEPGCQPDKGVGCQSDTRGVTPADTGGVTPADTPRTSLELSIEQTGASAPATHGAARSSPEVKQDPQIIFPDDNNWRLWLNWMADNGRKEIADACENEGAMVIFAPRPMTGVRSPMLAPEAGTEKRDKLMAKRRKPAYRDPTGEAA